MLQVLYNNFAMTHRVASTDSVIKGSHLGGTGKSMVKTISAMQMEQAEKLTTEEIEQVPWGWFPGVDVSSPSDDIGRDCSGWGATPFR
jgi:hypothetical protein